MKDYRSQERSSRTQSDSTIYGLDVFKLCCSTTEKEVVVSGSKSIPYYPGAILSSMALVTTVYSLRGNH